MSAWAAGDLALAVGSGGRGGRAAPGHKRPRKGGIYIVEAVLSHPVSGSIGLVFEGHHSANSAGPAWHSRYFRKIEPHTPDEEDAETIRLLSGAPAPVDA